MLSTLGIYLAFMVLVKLFGSRVLTSMTASDAIIIIMFGAVAGRVIIGVPPTLAAGVIGLTTLMALEAAFGTIRKVVKWTRFLDRRPVLIFQGEMIDDNLTVSHITRSDVYSAVRKAGLARMEDVQIMVLEPTGHISVIKNGQDIDPDIFNDLVGSGYIKQAKES